MKLLAIIGCAKSGTTALARHLGARPDMILGQHKEPRHFTDFAERHWTGPGSARFVATICADAQAYRDNFTGLGSDDWAIDSSTDYLWAPGASERLRAFGETNTVRIVCLVRDPVDRAVSEYNHTLRNGMETLRLADALAAEEQRRDAGWQPLFYHLRRSTICADLKRYHDIFGDRMMILDHARLADPDSLLAALSDFLGVPHRPADRIARENQSLLPRNAVADKMLRNEQLRRMGRLLLPSPLRSRIRAGLRTDARNLSTVAPEDITQLRSVLAPEIDRCLADPRIPTDNWTCTAD